jgi:hypothetical protein
MWPHQQCGHDDRVNEALADVAARYHAAQAAVGEAREAVVAAQNSVRARRAELHTAIVAAARAGQRQVDIAKVVGMTREQVRRICRAAGLE